MKYPGSVRVVEVGPRDGLQNEQGIVSAEDKAAFIEALTEAGLKTIECGSFVSPKWVPRMADTATVLARIRRVPDVSYVALVPNRRGLDAAIENRVDEIAIFASASETFSQRNVNCSIEESLVRLREVAEAAIAQGLKVRGYVSCVLGCPYEGEVALPTVARVANALCEMGCHEVSLGDTIGTGTPLKAQRMIGSVAEQTPIERIAVHFHDTWGQALANILASLDLGVAIVDSSAGGLGGCPYAAGATGNVATEDLIYMLDGMGIQTGVNLEKVAAAGCAISKKIGRTPASRASVAIEAGRKRRNTL